MAQEYNYPQFKRFICLTAMVLLSIWVRPSYAQDTTKSILDINNSKLIKKANQSNGLPVVIMVVNSPKNFIKGEIMDKMMSIISNELPDVVDSYKYIDNDLLSSALEGLHGKYNPKTLTIGTKRLDNYLLQARSLKKRKKLDKDFILQTAPEWVSSSEILNDLGEKNYLNFKKNVPKGLASIWEELTRCYESSK